MAGVNDEREIQFETIGSAVSLIERISRDVNQTRYHAALSFFRHVEIHPILRIPTLHTFSIQPGPLSSEMGYRVHAVCSGCY
jgi:hypothetical protein